MIEFHLVAVDGNNFKSPQDMTLATQQELEAWLQEGIGAAKAGQYERARFRLLDVVEQDHTNEAAWFWLYRVFNRQADKRVCLENLLVLNPNNEWAAQELRQYLTSTEAEQFEAKRKAPTGIFTPLMMLRLVAAFWAGISVIFLGGGIIATGQWLGIHLGVTYISVAEFFELIVAVTFIIVGVLTLNVAVGVYTRSIIGFYGSILMALGLLLVGPFVSLIVTPPNYISLVCTGGIPAMIVLLTLASPPQYKDKNQNGRQVHPTQSAQPRA